MKGMIFMGKKDTLTKQYVSDNTIFADLCNQYLYHGKQVIKPDQLHPLDPNSFSLLDDKQKVNSSDSSTIHKQRDVLKYLSAMTTDNAAYLILGIENQSDIHYAMPVRNMLYDALQYEYQMQEITKAHRNNKQYDAFTSGVQKQDKLLPVITLVVYFGTKPWDGPMRLHDMLNIEDASLLPYIADYPLQLIDPHRMDEETLAQFKSTAREVFTFIKHSKDKNKILELVQEPRYQTLDPLAANVINICTNSKLPLTINKEDDVNMCQAIDEIREDSRNEGRYEGIEIGISKERKEMALKLLQKGSMPVDEISELTELSLEEIEALQKAI